MVESEYATVGGGDEVVEVSETSLSVPWLLKVSVIVST